MLAGRQIGERGVARRLEGGPIEVIQAVRVKQSLARRELPLVLAAEEEGDGAPCGDMLSALGQPSKLRLRWIAVGFRFVQAQPVGRAGPEAAALVFVKRADTHAGQALFEAVLHPPAFIKPMQPAIGSHPQAPVSMSTQQAVDLIEPAAHLRPVPAIELPDFIGRAAPDFAIEQFGEADGRIRTGLVRSAEDSPFFLVIPGGAALTSQPQVAILRLEEQGPIIAQRRVRGRAGEGLKRGSVKCVQRITRFCGIRPALQADLPVLQQTKRLDTFGILPSSNYAEPAGSGMKLEQLLVGAQQEGAILQREKPRRNRQLLRGGVNERIFSMATLLQPVQTSCRNEPNLIL